MDKRPEDMNQMELADEIEKLIAVTPLLERHRDMLREVIEQLKSAYYNT